MDGKTLKGSYDRESGCKALHVVSAWATEHRLVLGQLKVADKSNEITAIPALLELLDLSGCIITIDAMGTQKAIAQQIRQGNANYVLTLKANHPTLYGQVKAWFEQAQAQDFVGIDVSIDERVETGHHRLEKRQVFSVPVSQLPPLHEQADWVGLHSVVMVVRVRQLWNKTTREVQFYLTSLDSDAQKLHFAPFVSIGALKIPSTGPSMSPLLKMLPGFAQVMLRKTWRSSDALPSMPREKPV